MKPQNIAAPADNSELQAAVAAPATNVETYEAPAIESVVTFDDLQREVFYAGANTVTMIVTMP